MAMNQHRVSFRSPADFWLAMIGFITLGAALGLALSILFK